MPVLYTDRLMMRPYQEADFDQMAELHGNADVMAHMRDGAVGYNEARRYFDSYLQCWDQSGISIWALIGKKDDAYMGECGFWVRPDFPGYSLRYILAEKYWGHGYAGEAASRALQWGFDTQEISQVTAVSQAANSGSIRILQQPCMNLEDSAHKGLTDFHRYAVSREEWNRKRATP